MYSRCVLYNALCGSIADCLLSTGAWPKLEFLWLRGNGVDVAALPAPAQSKCPSLYYLNLIENRLSSEDFRLMGGVATCDEPRDMCRHVWPKLRHLNISDTCLGIADGVSQFCMCCLLCLAFDCNQFGCQRNLRRFNTTDSSLRYISVDELMCRYQEL